MFDIIMSEGGKGMKKYNVLVVDDDKEIVRSIELFLKADGYEVIKAYNGLEAIDEVMENEIHLIILDNSSFGKIGGLRQDIRTYGRG